ncbi:MAG: hypothetical protein J6N19_18130, partial [Clostridium sp.]|nr:hypothetical protein [Clostridium sp.]
AHFFVSVCGSKIRWRVAQKFIDIHNGIYAFVNRGFPGYMFLKTLFAYFDYDEPRIVFFADYLAIMILFAVVGYYAGKLLKKK